MRALGGRLIGVFGGERWTGGEPLSAARAALAMRARDDVARVAVVTGRAVGARGAIAGEALERGAQLVEQAKSEVWLDVATARLLGTRFVCEERDAYVALAGEKSERPLSRPPAAPSSEIFVGRDRELASVESVFADVVEQPVARAVVITAPAGAGKTTLARHFVRRMREGHAEATILHAGADSVSGSAPYSLLSRALRGWASIRDEDSADVRRDRLNAALAAVVPADDATRVAAFLGAIVGAAPDSHFEPLANARQDPQLFADSIQLAVDDWLGALASRGPVLCVLEDLHWSDRPTVRSIDAALARLTQQPFMVLALARPDVREIFPDLWPDRYVLRIPLPPLSRRAADKLLRDGGAAALGDAWIARAIDRGEGNPFYLEELLRAGGTTEAREAPDTVVGMVQARLDALGRAAKRTLRVASVLGEPFTPDAVASLLDDVDATAIAAQFSELTARGVLAERERAFAFRHALVRDAAYAMLTSDDRRSLHARAATQLGTEPSAEAATVALHWDRAGDADQAIEWSLRAAEHALAASDFDGAYAHADRAVALGASGVALGTARVVQSEVRECHAQLQVAHALALEAMELLPVGSKRWFRAVGQFVRNAGEEGVLDEAREWGKRALEARPDDDAREAKIECLVRAGYQYLWAGDRETFERLLEALGVELAELHDASQRTLVHVLCLRGRYARFCGRPERYLSYQRETLEMHRRADNARLATREALNVAVAYSDLGCWDEAFRYIAESRREAQRLGLRAVLEWCDVLEATVLRRCGDPKAVTSLSGLCERFRESGQQRLVVGLLGELALAELLAGSNESAESYARSALEAAADPAPRAESMGALMRALVVRNKLDEALTIAESARELLDAHVAIEDGESGLRRGLIETLEAAGRHDAARAEAESALRCVFERAAKIHDPAIRASYLCNVDDHAAFLGFGERWNCIPAEYAPLVDDARRHASTS
jgi:tetratricopeptide (TPR) repeat protein